MLPGTTDNTYPPTDSATGLASDAAPAAQDAAEWPGTRDDCRPSPSMNGVDGGFRNRDGGFCDPDTTHGDAGGAAATDARADAAGGCDASDVTDASDARSGCDDDATDVPDVSVGEASR